MSHDAPRSASPRHASASLGATLTSPAGRRVIVALAVGQALLLLLFHEAVVRTWPPFGSMTVRTVYLTLVIAVPTTLYLLLDDPYRLRPWLLAGTLGVGLVPPALFTGFQAYPEAHVRSEPVFWPYGLAMAAVWFIVVAFLQATHRGRKRFDYEVLFHSVWYHVIALAFTALATGLFWGVLALWEALFGVLDITFFGDLFYDRRFVYSATGLVGGLGLVLARSYSGTTATLLRLLMSLLKALLPLVTTLALLFLAVLPFTGLHPLWKTGRPTVLMAVLMALTMLLVNGAFQDGPDTPPYPLVLRRLVEAGLVVLPAYAALSAYALSLRIEQYGWTAHRVWAVLVVAVLGAFTLAYAVAVFYRPRNEWMSLLKPANIALSLALAALLFLTQTPLLSPHRIAVNDQIERLQRGVLADTARDTTRNKTSTDLRDVLRYLRFDSGRRGYRALQALQRDERAFAHRPAVAARIDSVLRDTSRFAEPPRPPSLDPATLRAQIRSVPDTLTVPRTLLENLDAHASRRCLQPAGSCALLAADLHGNTRREFILISQPGNNSRAFFDVYARAEAAGTQTPNWHASGHLTPAPVNNFPAFLDSLQTGRFRLVPVRHRDLKIGQRRLQLQLD